MQNLKLRWTFSKKSITLSRCGARPSKNIDLMPPWSETTGTHDRNTDNLIENPNIPCFPKSHPFASFEFFGYLIRYIRIRKVWMANSNETFWPTQTPPTCSPRLRWEPTFRGSEGASSVHPDQIRYWRSPDIKLFIKLWQYWEIFDNEEFIFVEALSLAFPRIISQVDDKRRALIQLTLQLIRYTYKWDSRCQFLLELGVTASVWCRKS